MQHCTRDLLNSLNDDYLAKLARRWLDMIALPYDAAGRIDRTRPWIWTGDAQSDYGRISVTPPGGKRRKVGAHQVGFFLRHGYLPPVVRHTVRAASTLDVNPFISLEGGTQADNMRDRDERDGNAPVGTRNGRSKLNERKVANARRAVRCGKPMRAEARRLGVKPRTLRDAVKASGRTWRHVDEPPVE